jgi:UDP-2,4-diacetamido-2,4,6-trideoxy-beta-L-altropyranose hydrolase
MQLVCTKAPLTPMPTVVFRVDASVSIGTGHWMRCLALAKPLYAKGCRIVFLSKQPHKACLKHLDTLGFTWIDIANDSDGIQWLQLQPKPLDALIVDHYGINATWETQVRPLVKQLGVIDDLANAPHQCDWLINPSLHPNTNNGIVEAKDLYANYLPPTATVFAGPAYTMLHNCFSDYPKRPRLTTKPQHIGVCFGGSDPTGETLKLLKALLAAQHNPVYHALTLVHWTLVAGGANTQWVTLQSLVNTLQSLSINVTLLPEVTAMAPLMTQCDLWLGAGGTMTWERYATGLYGITISVANNQVPICKAMHQHGMGYYLGPATDVSGQLILDTLLNVLNNPSQQLKVATLGPQWVDGQGALRVYKVICDHGLTV